MSNPKLVNAVLLHSTGKGSRIHGPAHWAGVAAAGLTLLDSTPDELEPSYAESVRRYNAARLKERRAEWYAYHADQAERLRRTMEPLVAFHEARAAALCQESGRG